MAYSTGIMEEQERRGSGNEREEKQKIRNARKTFSTVISKLRAPSMWHLLPYPRRVQDNNAPREVHVVLP
jgi:hypothetical protein